MQIYVGELCFSPCHAEKQPVFLCLLWFRRLSRFRKWLSTFNRTFILALHRPGRGRWDNSSFTLKLLNHGLS